MEINYRNLSIKMGYSSSFLNVWKSKQQESYKYVFGNCETEKEHIDALDNYKQHIENISSELLSIKEYLALNKLSSVFYRDYNISELYKSKESFIVLKPLLNKEKLVPMKTIKKYERLIEIFKESKYYKEYLKWLEK